MTEVDVRCGACFVVIRLGIEDVHCLVCRDDESLSVYGYVCPTCGPQLNHMTPEQFHALDVVGVVSCYWERSEAVAEIRKEHAALIREFSDRLEDTLTQILSAA